MSHRDIPELQFPCEFVVKVMGIANDEFEIAALQIIRQHCPTISETAIQMRFSKDKKYLSLSVTFIADSREQLDALYQALTDEPKVLVAL